jgi:hypothetical protein
MDTSPPTHPPDPAALLLSVGAPVETFVRYAFHDVGKDMTLRDYAQGCYRMRGLGKGQSLYVFIVDEVFNLIQKGSLSAGVLSALLSSRSSLRVVPIVLCI